MLVINLHNFNVSCKYLYWYNINAVILLLIVLFTDTFILISLNNDLLHCTKIKIQNNNNKNSTQIIVYKMFKIYNYCK